MAGRGCLCDQPPVKNLGAGSLMSILVDISYVLAHLVAGGIKHVPCDSMGRGLWKLAPAPLYLAPRAFPFCWLCSHPFSVVSHGRE